jgi:hypothetical protein
VCATIIVDEGLFDISYYLYSCQRQCLFILFLAVRYHGEYEYQDPKSDDDIVNITFVNKNGKHIPIRGKIGDNLLYLGHRYGVEIEGIHENHP